MNIKSKFLYHRANPSFRKSIMKEGLIPQVGESYEALYDGSDKELQPLVFLYDGEKDKEHYDSTYDDDCWKIDVRFLKKSLLKVDEGVYGLHCYTYPETIPPKALSLIYKGSGSGDFGELDWNEIH